MQKPASFFNLCSSLNDHTRKWNFINILQICPRKVKAEALMAVGLEDHCRSLPNELFYSILSLPTCCSCMNLQNSQAGGGVA